MPASLRIEIFPSDISRTIDFYTTTLRFTLLQRKTEPTNYAYFRRDGILIGAVESHDLLTSMASTLSAETGGALSPEAALEKMRAHRTWPVGVEVVIEVDDLEAERDHVVGSGWALDDDIQMQEWGLRDFRVRDPDGYYIRITTHSKSSR